MTMPKWLDNFLSPAGILLLIGGITWGIQLNVTSARLLTITAENSTKINDMKDVIDKLAETQLTQTFIVEDMQEDHKEIKRMVIDHDKEAEKWKHKIIRCEDKIEDCQ